MVTRTCEICGAQFPTTGRGVPARWCPLHKAEGNRLRAAQWYAEHKADPNYRATKQARGKSDRLRKNVTSAVCTAEGCQRPANGSLGMCATHYARLYRGRALNAPLRQSRNNINPFGYVVRWDGERQRLEHRVVMEQTLGRALEDYENVHHLNGIRHDNRPENLEVWVTPQPRGQRPEDLALWVVEHYPHLVEQALRGEVPHLM